MKNCFLQLVGVCLFVISLGAASTVLVEIASPPAFAAECPGCVTLTLSCPGSLCNCKFDSQTQGYYCTPPTL